MTCVQQGFLCFGDEEVYDGDSSFWCTDSDFFFFRIFIQ